MSREDVELRGTLSASWTPWTQKRPVLRARVITRDGNVHPLDPATITESSGANIRNQVFLDNRVLSAPLPAVDVGAVVETEVVVEDHTAFCPVGVVGNMIWERISNCRKLYSEIRADKSVDLKLVGVGRDVPLTIEVEGEKKIWRLRQDKPARIKALWSHLPPGETNQSYVVFCTGTSWGEIAKYYHQMVEQQLQDAELGEVVQPIKNKNLKRREMIALACRQVFDLIRYTGLEFGISAIRPSKPLETLQRRYGDCKDQACLLIAMLRELDIEAHVALLNVQSSVDLAAQAPGLNAFDHAIVYVPAQGDLEELWIDMTSPFTSFGELPLADEERLALIAAPTTKGLKRTPGSRARDNAREQGYTYHLSADGPSRAVVWSTASGESATYLRSIYASQQRDQLLKNLKETNAVRYGLSKVNRVEFSDPHDISKSDFLIEYDFLGDKI
ncbi:MAG: DUF3857 domain-containing protein, partial [Pirellulales bacterium]|nr:DUF3857 domain-containing protein [Pirellulales bacterium]